jgi:hypothetical protein
LCGLRFLVHVGATAVPQVQLEAQIQDERIAGDKGARLALNFVGNDGTLALEMQETILVGVALNMSEATGNTTGQKLNT